MTYVPYFILSKLCMEITPRFAIKIISDLDIAERIES